MPWGSGSRSSPDSEAGSRGPKRRRRGRRRRLLRPTRRLLRPTRRATMAPIRLRRRPRPKRTPTSMQRRTTRRKPSPTPRPHRTPSPRTPTSRRAHPWSPQPIDATEVDINAAESLTESEPDGLEPASSFATRTMSATADVDNAAVTTAVAPPGRPLPAAVANRVRPRHGGDVRDGHRSSVVSAALSPFAAGLVKFV